MHAMKYKSKHLNGDPMKCIDHSWETSISKDKLLEGKSYLHSLTLNHESCIWASK